jgi:formate hydrogenlyase subunit 3/multisubunit Na+/H+ antiporter MnhD subunit
MIYNYLFYKGYQLGKWSKNFDDIPVLAGVMWVCACFIFNLFTIAFLLEGSGITGNLIFDRKYKFIFSLLLVLILIFYYAYKGRYKKIVEKYEDKERNTGKGLHPLIVVTIYFVISFGLMMIAGMYKNNDGIFS